MNIGNVINGPDGPVDMLSVVEPDAYAQVEELITYDKLPADTFLRLDSVGDNATTDIGGEEVNLRRKILLDLVTFAEAPEHLPVHTRNVIFKEPPKVMFAWDTSPQNIETLHTGYDVTYLIKEDLTDVIKDRRAQEGKTITETPRGTHLLPEALFEEAQCSRIAHGLWAAVTRRIMPEWVPHGALNEFYRAHKLGTTIDLGGNQQEVNRRVIHAVALAVPHVKEVFEESIDTGVRGIGPVGQRDLRALLAEEYPDLSRQYSAAAAG